jgi:hypothetical protein
VFPAARTPAVNNRRVALTGRTAMDDATVCAALNAALTGDGQFPQATAWDVVAACDALIEAARANGWIVAGAAPLSIDDLVMMMATTPVGPSCRPALADTETQRRCGAMISSFSRADRYET